MNIFIDSSGSVASARDASHIREAVFKGEWKLDLPSLGNNDRQLTLVARRTSDNHAVAALTVVETTGDEDLHARVRLRFHEGVRVARYTQLAVLKDYRGANIPIQLILAARRRFVVQRQIDHTWLLFPAHRAASSSICRLLGFQSGPAQLPTEYGTSRVLSRDERAPESELRDRAAAELIARMSGNEFSLSVTTQLGGNGCELLPQATAVSAQGINL